MFVFGCQGNFLHKENNEEAKETKEKMENDVWVEAPFKRVENDVLISVQSLQQLIEGEAKFDKTNKTLLLHSSDHQFYLIEGVPVVQKDGLFLPGNGNDFKIIDDQAWLSAQFLNKFLRLHVKATNEQAFINSDKMIKHSDKGNNEVEALSHLGSFENVIEIMSILESPIKKAQVDTIPSHLPGAKRAYRNGVHEGMDWYGFSTGVPINRNTEIFAMAKGVVVRADHEYNRYSSREERNRDLEVAADAGVTPVYILDRLRGRQVWVQYDNGLQARFAHLDRISADLQVGDVVNAHTLIGYVGNSGTSGDVKGDDTELHLHLDLLYRGELFWKGLTEKEIVKVLKVVFAS